MASAAPESAVASPAGQVLMVSQPSSPLYDCNWEKLVVLDVASGEVREIGECATDARFSPDRARIAFVRRPIPPGSDHLFLMRAEGGHERQLTHGHVHDSAPDFFPGGRRIAFSRYVHGHSHIYVVHTSGDVPTRVPHTEGGTTPAVSPDGRTIAFVRERSIYTIRLDGTGFRRLTYPARSVTVLPDFSPDGRRIVFNRSRDEQNYAYLMNADGTRKRQLSKGPIEERPVFSRHGAYVAYSRRFYNNDFGYEQSRSEVFVVPIRGGGERKLTDSPTGRTNLVTDWAAPRP